jgi:hypothetical protein
MMRIEQAATSIPCSKCGAKTLMNCWAYEDARFGQRTLATHSERINEFRESKEKQA